MHKKLDIVSFMLGILLCSVVALGIYVLTKDNNRELPSSIYTDLQGFNVTWDKAKTKFIRLHLTQKDNTIITIERNQVGVIRVDIVPPDMIGYSVPNFTPDDQSYKFNHPRNPKTQEMLDATYK